MIKYIKIHGLKALNKDIEISLSDYDKYVLIIGPNGSGKTTLLKHITNPMANSSGLNMVRDGYTEAYKEIILEYNNNTYKIRHIYRKSKNLSTNSYIAKLIDNEFVELCENGLVTNFKDIVARELEYYDHYNDLLNIGITNHGIVTMTDSNKLEYIKKIYNNKELDTMKDNVSKHYSFLNNKLKIEKDKLNKYDLLKTYEDELVGIKSRKATSLSNLNKTRTLLNDLLSKYNKDTHTQIQKERDSVHHLYKQAKYIRDYTAHFEESVSDYIKSIEDKINEYKIKLDNSNNNILEYNKEMQNFLDINKNSERREVLEKEYAKLSKDCSEYKFDEDKVDKCIGIIDNLIDNRYNIQDISFTRIYNILTKYDSVDDINRDIEGWNEQTKSYETQLKAKEESRSKYRFDEELLKHIPDENCVSTNCRLLNYYNEQKINKSSSDSKEKDIRFAKEKIKEGHDMLLETRNALHIYNIFSIEEDIFLEILDIKYTDIIKMGAPEDVLQKLKYIKSKFKDKAKLSDIQKELDILKEIEESVAKERVSELDTKLEKEIFNKKIYTEELKKWQDLFGQYSKFTTLDKNLLSYNKEKIKKVTNEYQKTLDVLDEKLAGYSSNAHEFEVFEETIKAEEDHIEDINNRIKEIEFKILAVKELENECRIVSDKLQKISSLRQIVNKILPSRVLGNLINDIENDVNRLLDGFMRVEFEKTDNGLRIICYLSKGNDNISNDLSQGEKSMLSIALLFAIKKYIPWKIVSIDEGSAAFDVKNKSRFIDMIESYSNTIDNLNQIFIVSHDHMFDEISKVIDLS